MRPISQGAESVIFVKNNVLYKKRLPKEYRIKELDDKIIKHRTKKEVNILKLLNKLNIPSPKILRNYENIIEMEYLEGKTIKELVDSNSKETNLSDVFFSIGSLVRTLHLNNIIHGDLTTSNFIYKDKVYVIDFGLSYISHKTEDKAVDLFVFEKSIRCAHDVKYIEIFYNGYNSLDNTEEIMNRLDLVRKRGRKREENF